MYQTERVNSMNSGINIATMIVMALTVAVIVFTIDHLIGGVL